MPTLRPSHFQLAVACLSQIMQSRRPADVILQEHFRERPQMGSRDRAGVGELVYGVLRDLRRLQAVAGADADAAALAAAHLLRRGQGADGVAALGYAPAPALAQTVAQFDEQSLTAAQRLNLPDWLHASLLGQHGDETAALAAALNQPASIDLRVNTLRGDRSAARAALASADIAAEPTPLSPIGLRLARRAPLQATRAFREGLIEPQDEGSQLLALLVAARPGDAVVDYCAGAGGKTLALGAAMNDQGRLFAFDTSPARLARLEPRARRAGLRIVQAHALGGAGDARVQRLHGQCDAVLVDAPCSGTGALRRNPELALREPDLRALAARQRAILQSAAPLVRPGGALVYATCSLLRAENEAVAQDFIAAHPQFATDDAGAVLRAQGVAYEGERLMLLPHRHGTDGFFAARFRRAR